MAKNLKWHDDYWLLLMQIYLQKPVGVKPLYSRPMVELSLELHFAPQTLFAKMCKIANLQTPRIEHIWEIYGNNPQRLKRAVSLLRKMKGFGNPDTFYEGVEMNETFERDWQPLAEEPLLTPMALVLILELYFRLTPATMVTETPEVQQLARKLKVPGTVVVDALSALQCCDPYLKRRNTPPNRLLAPCQDIWQRFGNSDMKALAQFVKQLEEYYK